MAGVLTAANLKYYQCTVWAESASHGGDIDLTAEITTNTDQNVFDDVTDAQRTAGSTEYRKIYFRNENATTASFYLWISTNTLSTDDTISVALAVSNADVQSAASAYTYYTPTSKVHADVLDLGSLAQNAYQGVWIKRVVDASSDGYVENSFTLTAENY